MDYGYFIDEMVVTESKSVLKNQVSQYTAELIYHKIIHPNIRPFFMSSFGYRVPFNHKFNRSRCCFSLLSLSKIELSYDLYLSNVKKQLSSNMTNFILHGYSEDIDNLHILRTNFLQQLDIYQERTSQGVIKCIENRLSLLVGSVSGNMKSELKRLIEPLKQQALEILESKS